MMKAQIFPSVDEAQQGRQKLSVLLDQTIDAMPEDTDPAEQAAVAGVLVGETLAGAVRKGLLPVRAHAGTLIACRTALSALPPEPSLAAFRAAAKAALRAIVTNEG